MLPLGFLTLVSMFSIDSFNDETPLKVLSNMSFDGFFVLTPLHLLDLNMYKQLFFTFFCDSPILDFLVHFLDSFQFHLSAIPTDSNAVLSPSKTRCRLAIKANLVGDDNILCFRNQLDQCLVISLSHNQKESFVSLASNEFQVIWCDSSVAY